LRFLEVATVDARFSVRGTRSANDVVVVAIDSRTFSDLDTRRMQAQWPFSRCYHAHLLDNIAAADPKVIALDLQFSEPPTVECDNALIEAVSHARPVILGATEVDRRGRTNVFGGMPLATIGAAAANTGIFPDYGGILRRVPYQIQGLTEF